LQIHYFFNYTPIKDIIAIFQNNHLHKHTLIFSQFIYCGALRVKQAEKKEK